MKCPRCKSDNVKGWIVSGQHYGQCKSCSWKWTEPPEPIEPTITIAAAREAVKAVRDQKPESEDAVFREYGDMRNVAARKGWRYACDEIIAALERAAGEGR